MDDQDIAPVDRVWWHEMQLCPIVYVAGYCNISSTSTGRAAFVTSWGESDWRNQQQFVEGIQNGIRAELTGLLNAVAVAVREKLPKIVFICKREAVIEELDKWENEPHGTRLSFSNADLLLKIYKLLDDGKDYLYWLALPCGMQTAGMAHAYNIAKNKTNESLTKAPTNNRPQLPYRPGTEPKLTTSEPKKKLVSVTCAINGICQGEGQSTPKAAYAVFFGMKDPRNASGLIESPQTSYRAELTALKSAMTSVIDTGKPTHLHVFTRSVAVKTFTDNFERNLSAGSKSTGVVVGECRLLASKLDRLTVELVLPKTDNSMLETAKEMAKSVIAASNKNGTQSQTNLKSQKKSSKPKTPTFNDLDGEIYDKMDRMVLNHPDIIPVSCRTIEVPMKKEWLERVKQEAPKPVSNGAPPVMFGRQTPSTSKKSESEVVVRVDCHQGNMFVGFQPRFGRTPARPYPFFE